MCSSGQMCPTSSTCCGGTCCDSGAVGSGWAVLPQCPPTLRFLCLHRPGPGLLRARSLQCLPSPKRDACLSRPNSPDMFERQPVLRGGCRRVRLKLLQSWLLLPIRQHLLPGAHAGTSADGFGQFGSAPLHPFVSTQLPMEVRTCPHALSQLPPSNSRGSRAVSGEAGAAAGAAGAVGGAADTATTKSSGAAAAARKFFSLLARHLKQCQRPWFLYAFHGPAHVKGPLHWATLSRQSGLIPTILVR